MRAHLRSGAQSVEHVEEDEAGEGHGGVSRSDHVVLQLQMNTESESAGDVTAADNDGDADRTPRSAPGDISIRKT